MANLDLIRGRQVVVPLLNSSGGEVIEGDVVTLGGVTDDSFITVTAPSDDTVGIVQETIAALGVGRVLISGYAPLVNVPGPVVRGEYLKTHSTAKQAINEATRSAYSAGQFSKSGSSPSAILWGALSTATGPAGPTGPTGPTGSSIRSVNVIIDGGGALIAGGVKGDVEVPFAWTDISSVTMLADQAGAIVVDVYKDTYANYPPVIGDKITASAPPTISSAIKSRDTTLTGWTKTGAAGDVLRFVVTGTVTNIQRVTISLHLVSA